MADENPYENLSVNNPLPLFNNPDPLPAPYVNVPSGMPPAVVVNNDIAGNYKQGPVPVFLQTPVEGGNLTRTIADVMRSAPTWAKNDRVYGAPMDYGAGWKAHNFERYYTHPSFQKLGFDPRRDNETIYNQNSTVWDDMTRMGNQWWSLAWSGFKSPYDFGSESTSYDFEKAMAIGSSSRGNVGSFFVNLGLQSAHTIGMMSEMIAENFLLAGVGALTGGPGGAVAGGAMGLLKTAPGVRKLFQFGDAVQSVNQLQKELREVNSVRNAVESVNTTGTLTKVGKFMNPFQETTQYMTNLGNGANGFREMSNFIKMRKGAGAVFRDLREINWAMSESLMEGNMARNEYTDKLMDDFYLQNGRMPTIEESKGIHDKAKSVDFAVSLTNAPIIYYSNRLVFDKLFKGFRPASAVEQTLMEGSKRTFMRNANWKAGESVYKFMENNAKKNFVRFITKSPYLPWTKKYFMGNISEGLQEVFQDVASDWWSKYYEDVYTDPAAAGMYSNIASLGSAMGNTFSMRGLETLLSGFLMGSIVQGVGSAVHLPHMAPALYKDLMAKGKIDEMKKIRRQQEDLIAKTVDNVFNDAFMPYNKNVDNALSQKYLSRKMDEASRMGDQAAYQDAKDQMMIEHLYFMASTGRMDLVTDHISSLQQLNDQELQEAFDTNTEDSKKLRERLSTLMNRAETMKIRYENYKSKFPNPFDPAMVDKTKEPDVYRQTLINRETWDTAVKDALITESLFERNVERNQTIYNDLASSNIISNAVATDITSIMSRKELNKEITVLDAEIKGLELGDAENKKLAKKKSAKLEALLDYRNNLDDYVSNYKRYRQLLVQIQNRSVVNKPGNIVVDKNSKEEYEILEINEDGSLLVMDNLGEMSFVDKKDVRPYTKNRMIESVLKKSNGNLFKSMRRYFATVANVTDSAVPSDEKMVDAFNKIRDNYTLQNENEYLTKTMNVLTNPAGLMEYADRLSGIIKIKHQNYAEYLKQSWANLVKVYKDNAFLNNLFDNRAAIDPEDAEKALRKGDFTDVKIYDIENGKEITKTDKRYDDIQKAIKQYKDAIADDIAKTKKKEAKPAEEEEVETESKLDQDTVDKLLNLVKKENKIRKDNDEDLLAENVDDPLTAKWLAESDDAQDIIAEATKAARKKVPTNRPAKGESFETGTVPDELKALKGLWQMKVVLTEDGLHYVDQKGNLYNRVSDLKVNKYRDEEGNVTTSSTAITAAARGNIADHILRKVVSGKLEFQFKNNKPTADTVKEVTDEIDKYKLKKKFEITFTDTAVKSLIVSINDIMEFLENNNLTLYSDIPSIWGEFKGKKFAGTIDLLAKDAKGNYYIIDLKTNSPEDSRRLKRGQQKYLVNDTIQLNAYAELFKQRTGKTIKGLYILPIMASHENRKYKVVEEFTHDIDDTADETLTEGMIPISMEKDIYELDEELGSNMREITISGKKKTKGKKAGKEEEVIEEEPAKFDKETRAPLREAGFFNPEEYRDYDEDNNYEIFGMRKDDPTGRIEIFEREDGMFIVSYEEMKQDKSGFDSKTYEETEHNNITDAIKHAIMLSEVNIERMRDQGLSEKAMKKQTIEAKIRNLDNVDDYNKYYDAMSRAMENMKWLKDNGFKSAVELEEMFELKAQELGMKKGTKLPSKNKDTKTKSKKAMDIINYEPDEVNDLGDELLEAEDADVEDLEKDFLKNTKC